MNDAILRVVVDTDTVKGPTDEQTSYLLGLLRREEIDAYNYSDHGPPESQIRDVEDWGDRYGVGWLLFERYEDFDSEEHLAWNTQGSVSFSNNPPSYRTTAVYGGDFLHIMMHLTSERLGLGENDQDQLRRDLTALLIADAAAGNILVTGRPALLDPPSVPIWPSNCQVCSVETALTIIGLWLRAKGVYVWHASSGGMGTVGRHDFYAIVSSDLLPTYWRWASGCTQSGDPILQDLAASLGSRLITALKARDRAHTAGFFMTDDAARDEARDCVEAVALHLMGAFDVAARVANQILGINAAPNKVGWQRSQWTEKLPSPGLKDTVVGNQDTISILRTLRNTIHHKAMHIGLIKNAQPDDADYYIVLPSNDIKRLEHCLDSTGGRKAWGIRETMPGQLWADPFVLIDQMIVQATMALDELLQVTPIEQLLPPNTDLPTGPPAGKLIWSEHFRRNIRRQLGGKLKRRAEEATLAAAG
jgi:hypothetical protein